MATLRDQLIAIYRKLGNFHVKIIHVLNIQIDLFHGFVIPTKIF